MRVLLVTRSLEAGGAERQIVELAKGLSDRGHVVPVVTMYGGGPLGRDLEEAGVDVIDLGKRGRWDLLRPLARLIRTVRRTQPDVVYAFRVSASLLVTPLRLLYPKLRIAWGVRGSKTQEEIGRYGLFEKVTFALTRLTARTADVIIANSAAGRDHHVHHGYPQRKLTVVPNGIDTERFSFEPDARERLRAEWRIPSDRILVGRVGRLDPMKDHPTFLEAVALIEDPSLHFVVVGGGPPAYADELKRLASALGLRERVHWTGHRDDMSYVYSALDICCSSSRFGEGFPNVIGEAMAAGVPCVVTDVGASAEIVGGTGVVVRPGDPSGLAGGIAYVAALLKTSETSLRQSVRRRVATEYSIGRLVELTVRALQPP